MRVYFGIKYHADLRNKAHIEAVLEQLEDFGHNVYCVIRDLEKWNQQSFSPQQLMNATFEVIQTSDIMLIDLSEKGVGLGIEAGYAHALKKPIIIIAQEGSDISTTLKGIAARVVFYKNARDLQTLLSDLVLS